MNKFFAERQRDQKKLKQEINREIENQKLMPKKEDLFLDRHNLSFSENRCQSVRKSISVARISRFAFVLRILNSRVILL